MERKPNPLLEEFFDKDVPLPELEWSTIPFDVNPWDVWDGYDESVEGWVPVWYPTHEPVTGRAYGEFERAALFDEDVRRVLKAMRRWPLWGNARQKKHSTAIALLQVYCELGGRCERV